MRVLSNFVGQRVCSIQTSKLWQWHLHKKKKKKKKSDMEGYIMRADKHLSFAIHKVAVASARGRKLGGVGPYCRKCGSSDVWTLLHWNLANSWRGMHKRNQKRKRKFYYLLNKKYTQQSTQQFSIYNVARNCYFISKNFLLTIHKSFRREKWWWWGKHGLN